MERRIKNNRYKNGGSSKDKWISDKIRFLENENKGRSHEQNIAIAFSMYDQEHKKQNGGSVYDYTKTGNKNIALSDVANINQTTGIMFDPTFAQSYFSEETNPTVPTQTTMSDFSTMPVKDITSDGLFTDRKIWYTDRAENFLGKSPAVEGKDYKRIPYSQWKTYQTSPAYQEYQNRGQNGMASLQIGGNYYENNNPYFMQNPGDVRMQGLNQGVSYTPQPITLQPQTNQVDFGNYSNQLSQQYPLPNTKTNGFTYNPNELSPYSVPPQITAPNTYGIQDTGSEYIQGDNNGDGVVDQRDQFDKNGNPLQSTTNVTENFSYFNPYAGFSIPDAAYRLGQGIGTGNAFDIGVSGLKLATGLGRNLVSGLGAANRRENILNEFQQKAKQASVPATQSLQNGGNFADNMNTTANTNINTLSNLMSGSGFSNNMSNLGTSNLQQFGNLINSRPPLETVNYIQPVGLQYQNNNELQPNGTNTFFQDGGQQGNPSPEDIINAYAQSVGQDPQEIIAQLQQLPEDQQAQAIQEMLSALQQEQAPQQEAQPVMQNGGRLKKKEENKIATGEYVAETPEGEKVAEVEKNEVIKKPDGTIQKVLGNSHEDGGTELTAEQLPDESKIISDHLKIGKNGAKKFNDEYDLGVKSTNTYADVIDKFNRKTGLDKIVKEQEELASKLQKQADKLLHNPNLEDTIRLNVNFLTEEFQELEQEKLPIIEARKSFFEEVFNLQEISKVTHNAEEVKKPIMQNGGMYNGDMIVEYSKKYNLPQEKVSEILYEFQNGGLTRGRVGVASNVNPYSKNVREQQSANTEAYGVVKAQEALQNLYNNFPNIINSDPGFKQLINVDTKGNVSLKGSIPLNKQSEVVGNVQRLIDENMKDSAQTIINNPNNFNPDAVKEAQRYLTEETFLPNTAGETDQARAIRGYDEKLGNFTSGRYSMQVNLVTPEEKQLLADNGILTVKQLKNSPLRAKLSAPSIKNLDNIEGLIGDTSADYGIAEVTADSRPLATTPSPTNKLPSFTANNQEINTYGLLNLPDQSPLLPDSLQGALKINRRYDRVEAPLVSPDAQVNEIRRQEASTIESLNSLPDAQRAAAIAQVQANTQAQLNNVIGQVAGQNQASTFQANAANAQIQAREEDARANDLLSYEGRILKADAITQQNLRNYYNTAQKVNLGNYNTVNSVNLINSMYDNARYTPDGVAMTNLDLAANYGNAPQDEYQKLLDAKRTQQKFNVQAKKKRFGGKK
jgi:hypothetical protein|nr:MAG TPA: hypothetical protein [Caudoviricetes sp.]